MYLSDDKNVDLVLEQTGLSLKELESIVGRFKSTHHAWPNKLKGQFVDDFVNLKIVHHFTKKILWTNK